jgi:nicotinamide mononucleotide transporter
MSPALVRAAEALAAVLNLGYTVGYMLEQSWAYPAAFVGSVLFVWVCHRKRLLAEAFLWAAYAAFAVWGMVRADQGWEAVVPDAGAHAAGLGAAAMAWGLGWVALRRWTDATSVGLDLFTTVGSLLATYWMVLNDPWNWRYWVVVNAAGVLLYARSGLRWGMGLQVLYLLLACEGMWDFLPWP